MHRRYVVGLAALKLLPSQFGEDASTTQRVLSNYRQIAKPLSYESCRLGLVFRESGELSANYRFCVDGVAQRIERCYLLIDKFAPSIIAQSICSRGDLSAPGVLYHAYRQAGVGVWIGLDLKRAYARNNGITEGFHRKMKLIQRRAYGFRNFNNYRLRVIAQCG